MTNTTYTTDGSVRGSCGHRHRSIRLAVQCQRRDQRQCSVVGGYSDRRVVRTDGRPLSEDEYRRILVRSDTWSHLQ